MDAKQEQTQKALEQFLKGVVKKAKTNLTKNKKNSSKALYNSLGFDVKVTKNSFQASIKAEDYGEYQDKGVSGVKRKFNTPFSYTTKRPPAKVFDKWLVRKGIAPRNEKGEFQSRKGLQFAMANHIFNYGIKPSLFLTKPFETDFKKLPNDVIENYGLDIETFLKKLLSNGKEN
jgi:hypothetical protein